MAKRLAGRYGYPAENPFAVTLHPERLDEPLRWKKPRRIFVNSMSDLFHKDVPDEFIDKVFAVMALAPRHTFQVLTKRPERMLAWFQRPPLLQKLSEIAARHNEGRIDGLWPLPNVWLGVSVENQQAADERIPLLLQTPAAVRWISAEPLLGPIQLSDPDDHDWLEGGCGCTFNRPCGELYQGLDWVVVGGESGPGARPMHPDWVRSLRNQCKAAGVPFLFKQWGEFCHPTQLPDDADGAGSFKDDLLRVGKKAAGRLLDGVLHDEYPERGVVS